MLYQATNNNIPSSDASSDASPDANPSTFDSSRDAFDASSDTPNSSSRAATRAATPATPAIPDTPRDPRSAALLEGFRLFLQFLIEQEAEYLCGAPLHERTGHRHNYRMGYSSRNLCTPIGAFRLRVPHLMLFCLRVPISKRAKRLAPQVLEILSRILDAATGGTTSVSSAHSTSVSSAHLPSVSSAHLPTLSAAPFAIAAAPSAPLALFTGASVLIRTLWTIELPDLLLASLTAKLIPILETWREQTLQRESPKPAAPSAHQPYSPPPLSPAPDAYAYAVY